MIRNLHVSLPSLTQFVYPDYVWLVRGPLIKRIKKGIFYLKEGESLHDVLSWLSLACEDALLLHASPVLDMDLELKEPLDYMAALADSRKIRYAKRLEKKVASLSLPDLNTFIKMSSLLKRWYTEIFSRREKAYKLFEALSKAQRGFLGEYFRQRKEADPRELLASVLTLMQRVQKYESQKKDLSDYYRKILVRVRTQSKKRLIQALVNLVTAKSAIPLDLRVIQFCFDLRGGQ